MKRLIIILTVLGMGTGLSMWYFNFHQTEVTRLATTIEKTTKSEKMTESEKTTESEKMTESKETPDTEIATESEKTPDTSPEKEDTDAVKEPIDPNSSDATEKNSYQGRGDGRRGSRSYSRGDAEPDIKRPLKEGEDPNDPFVAINLNNIEMKNILAKLAAWTGKVIIPTDEAMKVKITIYAAKEVPQSEALSLVYDALRAKGIIAEISENKLYLKPIAQAKTGRIPVLSVNEPLARIKDKSQIVEKYFKLKHSSPSKLVPVITALTASYGHVTAYESSRSIAVIDTVDNLFRIKETIAQFDVPESDQVVEEIFEIKNGDAIEIVQVFELIFQKTKGIKSSHTPRPPKPSSSGGKTAGTPATSVIIAAGEIPIVLLPVPKHNWIIARASVDDMAKIRTWITKLDIAETKPQEQTIISILYADPSEIVRLVKNTIQNMPGTELKTSIVVEAMRNSKQVVIFGNEENRKFVERLIIEIDLPVDDIYKSQVFRLKHADPDEVQRNLEGLYESQSGSISSSSYGRGSYSSRYRRVEPKDVVKVISFPSMKQVTVIATEENLIKIASQIKEWDVPLDVKENQYLLITLKNSDPVQMVELLSTLFSEDESGSSMNIMRMIFGGRDSGDTKKKIVGSLYGLLTFEAVPGTKKILIISKVPEAYSVIEALVKDLDSQEKGEAPKVITLNYADPEELCDQLNAILNESGTTATLKRKQTGLTLKDYSSDDNSGGEELEDPGVIKPWWDSARDDDTEMPLSNLIGKVRVIPVHRSKAILIIAPPEYYEEIEAIIKQLDEPVMQVMIEAIIVEVDHSSMTSLGVQLSSNPEAFGGIGQNAIAGLTSLDFSKMISKGLTLSANTDVHLLIDMLAKTVNAKILNQPNLWTKDNEEAVFFKGREISIQTGSQLSSDGGSQNTYEQKKVGVTLRVRPNITPSKDVNITINLEISDLASETVNGQTVINTLNTSTNLIIADGETIMLGGILFQTESEIKSKVPLLGDIPILGAIFSHKTKVLRNNELLIFLTPHVIMGKNSAAIKNSDAANKFIINAKEKVDSLKDTNADENADANYSDNPAERMQDIRKSLNDVLIKGMVKKP